MSKASLHIAVDCRVITPAFPGIGRATLETTRALILNDPSLRFTLLVNEDVHAPDLVDLAAHYSERVRLIDVSSHLRSLTDQWVVPRVLRHIRADIYHAPYFAIPLVFSSPLVVTLYDLIPRLFPQYWPNPVVRGAINAWTSYAMRQASRIIVCSQSTVHDIERLLPAYADKVRVVPLGVAALPEIQLGDRLASEPYLLYVGSNKPHKNVPRLISAFARVGPDMSTNLVIAGSWDQRYPEAEQAVQAHGLTQRILFEHGPSYQRLNTLYAGASGFIFPSLYEGFGLPVLEAMAAGIPVATTNRGSLGEIAGDAALLFDPDDEKEMGLAMLRLVGDTTLRTRLIAAGHQRAALFPWNRTAQGTVAIYEEVACVSSTSTKMSLL